MADFVETKALEQELERVSRALDVETGAHKAPLNSLSDSDFELLLEQTVGGMSGLQRTGTLPDWFSARNLKRRLVARQP